MAYLPQVAGEEYRHLDASPVLDMWFRWDAGFYTSIALQGYEWHAYTRPSADLAFLPLYPYAIRAANWLSGCAARACATLNGAILSNAALLASAYLLFYLVRDERGTTIAWHAVLLLLLSPISIFLSGVYTESFLLLLTLLTFWALSADRFYLAAGAATLASLTRTVGIALYFPLLLQLWQGPEKAGPGLLLATHLPLAGFSAYMVWAGVTVGDPLAYLQANTAFWDRRLAASPWCVFGRYFGEEPVTFWGWKLSWIDLSFAMFYLVLAAIVWKQRPVWGAFSLATVLIPVASGTLIAMPRYGAIAFPFYVLTACWADRPWRRVMAHGISGCLALLFAARFVTWHWIA